MSLKLIDTMEKTKRLRKPWKPWCSRNRFPVATQMMPASSSWWIWGFCPEKWGLPSHSKVLSVCLISGRELREGLSSPRWNMLWRGGNLNFWFSPRESFASDARKSYCSFSRNNGELEKIDLSLAAAPVSVGCWSGGHPEEGKLLKIGRRHCVWAPGSLRVQFLKVHQPGPPRLVSPQLALIALSDSFISIDSVAASAHNSFIFPVSSRGSFWSFLCMNIGASEDCVLEWAAPSSLYTDSCVPRVCLISWAACKIQDLESCSSLFDSVGLDGVKTF